MKFRTEIEPMRPLAGISADASVLLWGSCFSSEVGQRLADDGFDTMAAPMGPQYNPLSLAGSLRRCIDGRPYDAADFVAGPQGWHCLDFASRYSGADAPALAAQLNGQIEAVRCFVERRPVVILTLGTAWAFFRNDNGAVAGNCHKLPATAFTRRLLSVDEMAEALSELCRSLIAAGIRHIIFTVSPIRHLADGLHGNTISKASLHLAAREVVSRFADVAEYFPAFEIVCDDLRDYRFYASDMKHPSPQAVDYIYQYFAQTYFDAATAETARRRHAAVLASRHRPIL